MHVVIQKKGDKDAWLMNECGFHIKIEWWYVRHILKWLVISGELMEIKSSTCRKNEWIEKGTQYYLIEVQIFKKICLQKLKGIVWNSVWIWWKQNNLQVQKQMETYSEWCMYQVNLPVFFIWFCTLHFLWEYLLFNPRTASFDWNTIISFQF